RGFRGAETTRPQDDSSQEWHRGSSVRKRGSDERARGGPADDPIAGDGPRRSIAGAFRDRDRSRPTIRVAVSARRGRADAAFGGAPVPRRPRKRRSADAPRPARPPRDEGERRRFESRVARAISYGRGP